MVEIRTSGKIAIAHYLEWQKSSQLKENKLDNLDRVKKSSPKRRYTKQKIGSKVDHEIIKLKLKCNFLLENPAIDVRTDKPGRNLYLDPQSLKEYCLISVLLEKKTLFAWIKHFNFDPWSFQSKLLGRHNILIVIF